MTGILIPEKSNLFMLKRRQLGNKEKDEISVEKCDEEFSDE